MDRLRGCIHACYTDVTPTGLRCVCVFAICYIDAAPTGLDAFARTRCYIDVTPTGLRCVCVFAICYIDAAPTGLDAFARTRCYIDVAPTGETKKHLLKKRLKIRGIRVIRVIRDSDNERLHYPIKLLIFI